MRTILLLLPLQAPVLIMVNRYAGWLGTVGARCYVPNADPEASKTERLVLEPSPSVEEAGKRLAVVAGTSTCHIVQVCSSFAG